MTCCRQKLTFLPGKLIFCNKKTPPNRLFLCARTWVTWLWKAQDAKRLTPGQLQAYLWKLLGMTVQTSYVGGRHKNWAHTSPQHFFSVGTQKLAKKWTFLVKRSVPKKISTGKCFGASTHRILSLTHSGFRKYSQFRWPSLRLEVIAAQSEVKGKNRLCYEK